MGPPRDLEGADKLVQRALDIIAHFKPKYWWLENPATGLLHTRPCVQHLPKPYEAHYCMYGAPYRKPTHIWSNCPPLPGAEVQQALLVVEWQDAHVFSTARTEQR